MSRHILKPMLVEAAGNMPKLIEEFLGRANSGSEALSIARMHSPSGWQEAGQTPDFDEYTLVLNGTLQIETRGQAVDVNAGEAFSAARGE